MLNEKELKAYAKLMASRFLEDPAVAVQMGGLKRAELLFALICEGQIEAFNRQNAVHVLENTQGLLIGFSSKALPEERLPELFQQASAKLMAAAAANELRLMEYNASLVHKITKHDWYKQYYDGEVYHIMIVAVDKALKGTSACRELLMPVINECEEKKIPIIMQTHNPDNVPIYEHYGFRLIESHYSEELDLTCFCLAR
jgi:predicted GNAT family N-acyltransferase